MKTREQAEQRALELYPPSQDALHDHIQLLNRQAYLQCWEDMQVADDKIRESAEKVVLMIERDIAELYNPNNSIGGMCTVRGKIATIKDYKDELEKALK